MRKISVLTLLLAMSMMTAWSDPVSKNLAPYFVFAEGFLTVATGIGMANDS